MVDLTTPLRRGVFRLALIGRCYVHLLLLCIYPATTHHQVIPLLLHTAAAAALLPAVTAARMVLKLLALLPGLWLLLSSASAAPISPQ